MMENWIGPDMVRSLSLLILVVLLLQLLLFTGGRFRRSLLERRVGELEVALWRQRVIGATEASRSVQVMADGWQGLRKFEVARIVEEGPDTRSFYLRPHDGRPLPPFLPGQHLTFQFHIPGQARPVIRCYSLSAGPDPEHYRITVKRVAFNREDGSPYVGCSSGHLHDQIQVGDILDVKAPGGNFHLQPGSDAPVVLLAGGVGITPFSSMLGALADGNGHREIWLFYGAMNGKGAPLRDEVKAMAQVLPQVQLRLVYSKPEANEQPGIDFDAAGHLSVDYLARELPSNNYDFYLCGPPPMMSALTEQLGQWGVPPERIHSEAFGPVARKVVASGEDVTVRFARSGRETKWREGTLLDLAEREGIAMDFGCRAGNCGACLTAVKSGEVLQLQTPGFLPEAGSCLPCISAPKGALELDA
jgi:uncharacterized protein